MFVFVQVSSMKIRRPAATLFWCRFHCAPTRDVSAILLAGAQTFFGFAGNRVGDSRGS
jgi:hypothetical protein